MFNNFFIFSNKVLQWVWQDKWLSTDWIQRSHKLLFNIWWNIFSKPKNTVSAFLYYIPSAKGKWNSNNKNIFYKSRNWIEEQTVEKIPIAFDIEWPISYCFGEPQERTALIQLCAKFDECFLFHVINLEVLPDALIEILIHSKVIIHGIKIKGWEIFHIYVKCFN